MKVVNTVLQIKPLTDEEDDREDDAAADAET